MRRTCGRPVRHDKWTLVGAAGDGSDTEAREALAALCQTYWPPLYSYLRRHGHDREEAEDLVQGFFARLLERRDVGRRTRRADDFARSC